MAIINQSIVENNGLIKELDKDSLGVILDIVQKDIYSFPIPSTVRENFSNAKDSIQEKLMAISILTGETSEGDHFVVDNRIESKASVFDKDYYNLDYLDKSKNKVNISYVVNEELGKDKLYFSDFGVGLGDKRLEGYFRPGYSSKRLLKDMLGKYGLGSKSALANNGIEFYVLETWYNGYYTKFMIYDDYYKCILPKENSSKVTIIAGHKEVDGIIVEAEEKIFWEKTGRKNGVSVSFEVKTHNKEEFVNAVKQQLLYFEDHLTFMIVEDGVDYHPSFKADILADTPLFTVSKNNYFQNPHILINGVNYGNINFPELGMNKIYGSVAVKAKASDVDINASRESVKWTEKTRTFIQSAIESASKEAGKYLEKELDSIKNPIERYLSASRYGSQDEANQGALIRQLRSFGGSVQLKVIIKPEDYLTKKEIISTGSTLKTVEVHNFRSAFDRFKVILLDVSVHNISVVQLKYLNELQFDQLYYMDHESGSHTLKANVATYIEAKISERSKFQLITYNKYEYKPLDFEEFKRVKKTKALKNRTEKAWVYQYKLYLKSRKDEELYSLLFLAIIKKYSKDVIEIDPEDLKVFTKSLNLVENPVIKQNAESKAQNQTVSIAINRQSDKEIQKLNLAKLKKEKQVLTYRIMNPSITINDGYLSSNSYFDSFPVKLRSIKTADLLDITGTIVYSTTVERPLLSVAAYMYLLAGKLKSISSYSIEETIGEKISFIQIAKDNIKFFNQIPNAMSVQKFIKSEHKIEDKKLTLTFGSAVQNFVTGIYLHGLIRLHSVNFKLRDSIFIDYLKQFLDAESSDILVKVGSMLKTFPIPKPRNPELDNLTAIKEVFKMELAENDSNNVSNELIQSLYSLSTIQNTLVENLNSETKTMVNQFDSVEVSVYDKNFIDEAEQALLKYREVLVLLAMYQVVCNDAFGNNVKLEINVKEIVETQIEEKLLSLK